MNVLWARAAQCDAEGDVFGAIASYTLLVLAEDDDASVASVHFGARLSALLEVLREQQAPPLLERPVAKLTLLRDHDEAEEEEQVVAAAAPLQVHAEGGSTRLLVCVGQRGFIAQPDSAAPPGTFPASPSAGRFEFATAGLVVHLPGEDEAFAAVFVAPLLPRVLDETTQAVRCFSESVAAAIRSGGAALSSMIESGGKSVAARVEDKSLVEANGTLRDSVMPAVAGTSQLVRETSEDLSGRLKVSGSSAAKVFKEQVGPPGNAAASSGLTLAVTAVTGAMGVLGALWDSAGQVLKASGQGAVDVAASKYGPQVGSVAQQSLDSTVNAVVVVDKVLGAPMTFVQGALEQEMSL